MLASLSVLQSAPDPPHPHVAVVVALRPWPIAPEQVHLDELPVGIKVGSSLTVIELWERHLKKEPVTQLDLVQVQRLHDVILFHNRCYKYF